jgi:hypothetical protein
MTTTTTGMLDVSGAVLHYQVAGTGPLLLISQSGEGNADRSNDLVAHLTTEYTVVTYDRRGLSRSRLDDPARGAALAEHADDVHHVPAELTDEPALMLGCSLARPSACTPPSPTPAGSAPDRPRARHPASSASARARPPRARTGRTPGALPHRRTRRRLPRDRPGPGHRPQQQRGRTRSDPAAPGRATPGELRVLHRAGLHRGHPRHPRRRGPPAHTDPHRPGDRHHHADHRLRPPVRPRARRTHRYGGAAPARRTQRQHHPPTGLRRPRPRPPRGGLRVNTVTLRVRGPCGP